MYRSLDTIRFKDRFKLHSISLHLLNLIEIKNCNQMRI